MPDREPTLAEIFAANHVEEYILGLVTTGITTMRLINQGAATFSPKLVAEYVEEFNRRVDQFTVDTNEEDKDRWHAKVKKGGKIIYKDNGQEI